MSAVATEPKTVSDVKEASKLFLQPHVNVGDTVLFATGPDTEPAASLVTKVGHNHICIAHFDPLYRGVQVKDGVRHRDDPLYRKESAEGYWYFSKHEEDLRTIVAHVRANKQGNPRL